MNCICCLLNVFTGTFLILFQAFTLTGDQVYCFPSLRYYSTNTDTARYLTANVAEDIVKMEEELGGIKSELDKNRQKLRGLTTEIHKNESEARKADTQLMKISQRIRKLKSVWFINEVEYMYTMSTNFMRIL